MKIPIPSSFSVKALNDDNGRLLESLDCIIRGQHFSFVPGGGLYWAETETLLLADLHFGKAEALQRRGVPVPNGADAADLAKLRAMVLRTGAKRLIMLGDVFHAKPSGREAIFDLWNAEPPQTSNGELLQSLAVIGNHDRHGAASSVALAGLDWLEVHTESDFSFHHEPSERVEGTYGFCGHLHPCLRLGGVADKVRFPVFWLRSQYCVLPAFGALTGGANITLSGDDGAVLLTPAGPRWVRKPDH